MWRMITSSLILIFYLLLIDRSSCPDEYDCKIFIYLQTLVFSQELIDRGIDQYHVSREISSVSLIFV